MPMKLPMMLLIAFNRMVIRTICQGMSGEAVRSPDGRMPAATRSLRVMSAQMRMQRKTHSLVAEVENEIHIAQGAGAHDHGPGHIAVREYVEIDIEWLADGEGLHAHAFPLNPSERLA